VRGIMNLRGTLITVVDLSVRLGAQPGPPPRVVIVVEGLGKKFGLGVESVQGVADVSEERFEAVDAQRNSGGVIGSLAAVEEGKVQVCEVQAIARESLSLN
jgi:purine-binding chemotaxis protein CheW